MKKEPKPNKKDAAIAIVLAAGFVPAGETRSETVRVPTENAPIVGRWKSGGEIATFGGRARFEKPGTTKRVTIGKVTTCFYEFKKGEEPYGFNNFDTGDVASIERAAS